MDKEISYPDLGQSLGLIIRFLLLMIPFYLIGKIFETDNMLWNSVVLLLTYTIPILIVIVFGIKKTRKYNPDFHLKFNMVEIRKLLPMLFMGIAVTIFGAVLVAFIPMTEETETFYQNLFHPNIFFFILAVLIGPFLEEILIRGIILEGLLKNYSVKKAIIASAIFIGIAHLSPWQAITAFLLGLLIGWLYWKTNSLIPGIILHSVNNLFGYIMLSLNYSVPITNFKLLLMILLFAPLIVFIGYKMLLSPINK